MAATRYNRIIATDVTFRSSYPLQWVAYEIRFYTGLNQSGTEFALLGTAIGEIMSPYYAANATDNNSGTFWASSGSRVGYWGIDSGVGNAYELQSIAIKARNYQGTEIPKSFMPQTSTNGTEWVQSGNLITNSIDTTDGTWQYFNVVPMVTTYSSIIPAMTIY